MVSAGSESAVLVDNFCAEYDWIYNTPEEIDFNQFLFNRNAPNLTYSCAIRLCVEDNIEDCNFKCGGALGGNKRNFMGLIKGAVEQLVYSMSKFECFSKYLHQYNIREREYHLNEIGVLFIKAFSNLKSTF